MANFQFPNPAVSTTATNPVTGAVYQWKADPGKWVLTGAPEVNKELNLPFVNSYRLVNPDDFIGEAGTATLETDAYANGVDSYLSPAVEIARFASLDLNGRKHEAVNIDESFELSPTEYDPNETSSYAYGKFKVTSKSNYTEYSVDYDSGRAFRFIEGDVVYYRPSSTGIYVEKKGGDTMEGPLKVTGQRSPNADGIESTLEVLNIDSAQNSDLLLKRQGKTGFYVATNGNSTVGDFKFITDGAKIVSPGGNDLAQVNANGIFYDGTISAERHLVNKEYVDTRDEILQQEIIELEEEIEALAPTTERGSWTLNLLGTVANPGQFTMYDGPFGSGGPNGKIQDVKSIWFNELDTNGTPHGFARVEEGDLLELFVDGSPEYGLWSVVGTPHDETQGATQFWVIDVDFERTLADDTSFNSDDLCRLKIFKAPEGGSASEFVLKSGDTMSGDLAIDRSNETDVAATLELKGNQPSTTNPAATITFENEQGSNPGYLSYKASSGAQWFQFNQDVDLNGNGLHSVARIRMSNNGSIGSGNLGRLRIRNGGGSNGTAGVDVLRPGDDVRSFAIQGKAAGSNDITDFFYSYANPSGGDAINYTGKIESDSNIVNKKYVDDNTPGIEIYPGNKPDPEVGDMWYNSKNSVLVIKVE